MLSIINLNDKKILHVKFGDSFSLKISLHCAKKNKNANVVRKRIILVHDCREVDWSQITKSFIGHTWWPWKCTT